MVSGTAITEEVSEVEARRLWNAMVKDSHNLFPKVLPELVASVTSVQGDGGVGSMKQINFTPAHKDFSFVKERVDEIDEEKMVLKYTNIEGGVLGNKLSAAKFEVKLGGCVARNYEALPGGQLEESKAKEIGKGHALIALHSAPQKWIIDSGASHHMACSKVSFSSLHAYSDSVRPIFMGDNSAVHATGQGIVKFEDGSFENVWYVPGLCVNLLSVYQMRHTGGGRKVEFTPDSVSIYDMQTNLKIASGKVNDQSRLYTFSDFVPQSDSILLLTHANEDVDMGEIPRKVADGAADIQDKEEEITEDQTSAQLPENQLLETAK